MPWDGSHMIWKGGQYERPLSPEELARLEWQRTPAYRKTLPKSVRDSMARGLRQLRREYFEATRVALEVALARMAAGENTQSTIMRAYWKAPRAIE